MSLRGLSPHELLNAWGECSLIPRPVREEDRRVPWKYLSDSDLLNAWSDETEPFVATELIWRSQNAGYCDKIGDYFAERFRRKFESRRD
jgi:hypothetical protein